MIVNTRFFAVFFVIIISSISAHAACSNNEDGVAGVAGEIEYFTADDALRYCDGTNWVDMVNAFFTGPASSSSNDCGYGACGGDPDERVAFISSTTTNGSLGGVQGANTYCQTRAETAGLSGRYIAWIANSNPYSAPAFVFERASMPYVRVDGVQIADDWTDLVSGTINSRLNVTEVQGAGPSGVFTNVTEFGLQNSSTSHCVDFTSSGGVTVKGGASSSTDAGWTNQPTLACNTNRALYCFEQLGPKHVWTFDEGTGTTAADSKEAQDLTTFEGTIGWEAGPRGSAVTFDDGSQLRGPNNAGTPINDTFSFSGWMKVSSSETGSGHFFGKNGGANSTNDFRIVLTSGEVHIILNDGSGDATYDTNFTPTDNIWYHYGVTRNSAGLLSFYVNGTLETSFSGTIAPQKIIDEFRIGKSLSSNGLYGSIDDIRIYNYDLTAEEINDLYEGPIAHFKLDETSGTVARDSSVYINNASMIGGLSGSNSIDGPIDTALNFDGTDDYISLGTDGHLKPPLPVTISAWVRADDFTNVFSVYRSDYKEDSYSGFWMRALGDGRISINYGDNLGTTTSARRRSKTGTTGLSVGQWYHVVGIIRSSSDMSIYINGVDDGGTYDGTAANMAYSSTGIGAIGIGDYSSSNPPYYSDGRIDDVRIYPRAITESEITALYNAGKDKANLLGGLIGHWKLDETTGTSGATAADSSGNGNIGTYTAFGPAGNSVAAPVDTGINFADNINYRVNIPSNSVMNPGSGPFTVMAWFRPSSDTSSGQNILAFRNESPSWRGVNIAFDGTNNRLSARLDKDNGLDQLQYDLPDIASDRWHHVAVLRGTDNAARLYIDGVEMVSDTTASGDFSATLDTGSFTIASRPGGANGFFGAVDDVRLYSRALDPDEIAFIYANADRQIPCTSAGEYFYNTYANTYQWCDGSVIWFMAAHNSGTGGCTAPIGSEGAMNYNTDRFQYCDGNGVLDVGK